MKNEAWGCPERDFDHLDAFGGSYGCRGSILMDLGVILDSILRAISALNFVIFQAIIWLIVGCGFESILINFEVYFDVFRSKSVVYHETCEIVKNLCFTLWIQWFPGFGIYFLSQNL
jgi:hypothetical protein